MKKSELIKMIKEETQNVISEDMSRLKRVDSTLDRVREQVSKLENGTPLYSAISELENAVREILYHLAGAK